MTCTLLTPWWRRRIRVQHAGADVCGSTAPTPLLNWRSPEVATLHRDARAAAGVDASPQQVLQAAHRLIASRIRPVYSVEERQAASRTLQLGRGSCSQRLAVLEAVARTAGVPTRVRALLVDGRFWYPRFRHLRLVVPDVVVLVWPEFLVGGAWRSAAELFAPLGTRTASGFTNRGGETLFDAVARTDIDWDGASSTPGACSACDLSAHVLRDLGRYDSRDELLDAHGQTMCRPARTIAGPLLSRWSAGERAAA